MSDAIPAIIVKLTTGAVLLNLYDECGDDLGIERWVPKSVIELVYDGKGTAAESIVDIRDLDDYEMTDFPLEFHIRDWFLEKYEEENGEPFYQ